MGGLAMILALHDIRRGWARFLGTGFGLGLLFTVVLAMAGIYAGVVEDAVALARAMNADLWVVQEGTRGPFADASTADPSSRPPREAGRANTVTSEAALLLHIRCPETEPR